MAEKNNQDVYDNNADSATVDAGASALRHLLAKGKKLGYITMEELNKVLPSEKLSSEKIEDVMSSISDMGINIISDADIDTEDEENADNGDYDYEQDDTEDEEVGNIDSKDIGHSDDPVRMYLKEMGLVELLSRDGEIAISKRIEDWRFVRKSDDH